MLGLTFVWIPQGGAVRQGVALDPRIWGTEPLLELQFVPVPKSRKVLEKTAGKFVKNTKGNSRKTSTPSSNEQLAALTQYGKNSRRFLVPDERRRQVGYAEHKHEENY